MENYTLVLFILAVMIGLSAIADKIKLPYPIILISAGIAIGFIPSLPKVELNPEIIFLIFLPPLLYDASFNISFRQFRLNMNTISALAIGLVFMTVVGVAVIAKYCIPGMSWPLSFVLGAILSATDAVAAMSITKGLGLSHK
jgi:NhaP-type Na+/H+ or K+/H+ antiporter